MKKLFLVAQWMVVAAFAVWMTYSLLRPASQPEYEPATWRSWKGFSAISHAGIGRRNEPWYPSTKTLGEHLAALRRAGYQTIRPEDVAAFLDGRPPLPEKALLLLFEGGRKEAFIRATPILQRTGFRAVIAVPTVTLARWGSFYLNKREIARAARLPQWDFGSMGHRACEKIEADSRGTRGPFLTRRRWLGHALEDPAMFQERVFQDYAESARVLTEALGRPPLLYLYPFGDPGLTAASDPLAMQVNREGVRRHFRIAFTGGTNPFNGSDSDPWFLSRLRVRNSRAWTWLNGERIAEDLPLTPTVHRGRVGLGAEIGPIYIRSFQAEPLPARLALTSSLAAIPAARRSELCAVLPAWFATDQPPSVTAERQEEVLFAESYGIETIPVITSVDALLPTAAQKLAAALDDELETAGLKPSIQVLALDGLSESLAVALRERGYLSRTS